MLGWLLWSIVIATNVTPSRGQIGANYFDALKQSQVWINLEPQNLQAGPNPIELNVTASFAGRHLPTSPAVVDLRVQAPCHLFPTRLRQPVLRLLLDGSEPPLGREAPRMISGCSEESRAADAMVARIPFTLLRQIASARVVDLHALGFEVRLARSDLRALASFIAALTDGVTVK